MFLNTPGYLHHKNTTLNIDEILNNVQNLNLHSLNPDNIFRNDDFLKPPKQIQHLEILPEFKKIGNLLKNMYNIEGEIINMQLFVKVPNSKITKPHQDGAYFQADNYVTFWIPLQDVDELNSCLHYLDNSFDKGLLDHKISGSTFRVRSCVPGYSLEYNDICLSNYKPIKMKKGDILCHHPYTLHFSDKNFTKESRMALTCIIKI